jgi:hypothetical protein
MPNPPPTSRSFLHKLLSEPTLHFLLIAAGIFAFYSYQRSGQENLLEVSQREIDARVFMAEMSLGEQLNEEQLQAITAALVEEQILVAEAIKLGLDNDARINDMLAQKMRHVLSGNVVQPSSAELQSFYQINIERYRTAPVVSADELVFSSTDTLSDEILQLLSSGAEPAALLAAESGSSSFLPQVNDTDLGNIFSRDYAQQVFAAELNSWVGPYISNRGQHWLRVLDKSEARLPALNEIRERLRLDWIESEEDRLLQAEIDALWESYSIVITNDSDTQ